MRALVLQGGAAAALKSIPVPTLGFNEVLVKVDAVALNPTDWKHIKRASTGGYISGCDFAGVVVQFDKDVTNTNLKIGDRVSGFVHGGTYSDRGAFAEYVKADSDLVWKVPSNLSQEEASTLNCGAWTAVQALYQRLPLALPTSPSTGKEWFFVYGGSTSVGQFAIQLAKASGYKVITVASPRNHELVKSLGADAVFDYNSPTAIEDIKLATHDSIQYSIDTISLEDSQLFTVKVHSNSRNPLKSILLLPKSDKVQQVRSDVDVQWTLIYTALGKQWGDMERPGIPEDHAFMTKHLHLISHLTKEGKLKANKVKLFEGGLERIFEGLQYMEDGKVSAEKVVYKF